MPFSDLRHEQARQIVDVEQIFAAYSASRAEERARYAGLMSWKRIGDGEYLYRKTDGANRSLGPRSEATEESHRTFHGGRDRARQRLAKLAERLDRMAPVNRALGIGRLPKTAARILRALEAVRLLGRGIDVVGTNALFAYERMAAVSIESGLLATGDIDLLFDARRSLRLTAMGVDTGGLLGILRKIDRSFAPTGQRSFRAINDDGFVVDLIKPMPGGRFSTADWTAVGAEVDLHAVEIEELVWLVNSPKHRVVVIDERGYPLEMSVPDPRAFALHRGWLASRADREPIKRLRDLGQARLIADLVASRLPHLSFAAEDLTALPLAMRRTADLLLPASQDRAEGSGVRIEPGW